MGYLLWFRSGGDCRIFYDNFVSDLLRRQWARNQPNIMV